MKGFNDSAHSPLTRRLVSPAIARRSGLRSKPRRVKGHILLSQVAWRNPRFDVPRFDVRRSPGGGHLLTGRQLQALPHRPLRLPPRYHRPGLPARVPGLRQPHSSGLESKPPRSAICLTSAATRLSSAGRLRTQYVLRRKGTVFWTVYINLASAPDLIRDPSCGTNAS